MDKVSYRWLDGPTATDAEWDRIDDLLSARGWMSLSRETTRILVAEDAEGNLKGFFTLQLTPQCGPMYVAPSARATGLADALADKMLDYLIDAKARGWFIVADNPHVPSMCESRGMKKLTSPVYVAGGMGE